MKLLHYISLVLVLLISSCSSSKINSVNDLQGQWVSRLNESVYPGYPQRIYYQFTFLKDSFFVEIGELSEDTDISYRPFKAKGLYKVSGDYLVFTGVAKAEGSTKFNLDYSERFEYDYSTNYLSLYSNKRWYLTHYDLIRRSPIIK